MDMFKYLDLTIQTADSAQERWRSKYIQGTVAGVICDRSSESKCLQEGSETCCSVIYGWETVTLFNRQEEELEVAEFHWEWPGWTGLEMSIEQEQLMFCILKAKFERIEE